MCVSMNGTPLEMNANLAVSLFQSYKSVISVQNVPHGEIYDSFTNSESWFQ